MRYFIGLDRRDHFYDTGDARCRVALFTVIIQEFGLAHTCRRPFHVLTGIVLATRLSEDFDIA